MKTHTVIQLTNSKAIVILTGIISATAEGHKIIIHYGQHGIVPIKYIDEESPTYFFPDDKQTYLAIQDDLNQLKQALIDQFDSCDGCVSAG